MWPPYMKQIRGNRIVSGPESGTRLLQKGHLSKFLRVNAYCMYLRTMQYFKEGFRFTTRVEFVEDDDKPIFDKEFFYESKVSIWTDETIEVLQPCFDRRNGDNILAKSRLRLFERGQNTLTAYTQDIFNEATNTIVASRHSFPIRISEYEPKSPRKVKRLSGTIFVDQTSIRSRRNIYHFIHAMTVACRLSKEFKEETVNYAVDFKAAGWRQEIVAAMERRFENLKFIQIDDDTSYILENAVIVSEEVEWLFDYFGRQCDYVDVCKTISSYFDISEENQSNQNDEDEQLKNLILVRPKEIGRSIVNDAELYKSLEKFDYSAVRPELLSYGEQIKKLFPTAKFVFGVGGAAFVNIAFCPPGATIAIIHDIDEIDPFWNVYANVFGMNYVYFHSGAKMLPDRHYEVDPLEVKGLFERVEDGFYGSAQPEMTIPKLP